MIAIIAAIAVISVIATIVVIAIIGTSVDAENGVLCTESAEKTAYNHPVAQIGPLFRGRRSITHPGRLLPQVGPDRRTKSSFSSLSRLLGLKRLDASKPASSAPVKSRGLLF